MKIHKDFSIGDLLVCLVLGLVFWALTSWWEAAAVVAAAFLAISLWTPGKVIRDAVEHAVEQEKGGKG